MHERRHYSESQNFGNGIVVSSSIMWISDDDTIERKVLPRMKFLYLGVILE